ncbi:hypothetical protein CISIN_1g036736mg [Citrus sinensis]|uniref:Rab-GAP TBC domain-containing protein n=1 Tax=Citrus sinensis TaxID=2711 RepID=A0A067FYX6_CITSI|nr:hypothetical protein CISIN_1g036736mg [Citrus sinensis]
MKKREKKNIIVLTHQAPKSLTLTPKHSSLFHDQTLEINLALNRSSKTPSFRHHSSILWITLLLTHEFNIADNLHIWDTLLSDPDGPQCSDKLGLSLDLGSFIVGVMISTTDFAKHTLDQEACRSLCKFQFSFRVLSEDDIVAGIFTGSLARNLIVGVLALIFGIFVG